MPGTQPDPPGHDRPGQVTAALRLVWASVLFGIVSGSVSVTTGIANHSLSVLAVGLGVVADVTGSATLIWRFQVLGWWWADRAAALAVAAIAAAEAWHTAPRRRQLPSG